MGVIKPTYNNFSSGEITPRLYGRSDSPVFATGVERMENFVPDQFGSARRRGGFEFLDAVPGVERIIPWSIDNELDILILLGDKSMKFYAVWRDPAKVNGFLFTRADGVNAPINITEMPFAGGVVKEMYIHSHIQSIKYAQGIKSIYFAHQEYPLFFVRFVSFSEDNGYELEYGQVGFDGNWAYTPDVEPEKVIVSTDPLSTQAIMSKLGGLPLNVEVNAVGSFINERAVTTIKRIRTGSGATLEINLLTETMKVPVTNSTGVFSPGQKICTGYNTGDYLQVRGITGAALSTFYAYDNDTGFNVSDIMDAMRRHNVVPICSIFVLGKGLKSNLSGSATLREASTRDEFIVNFSSGGPITINNDTSGLIGYIAVDFAGSEIRINKNTITGGGKVVLDNVASWMTPDVRYPCDSTKLFMDIKPQWAVKRLIGKDRKPVLYISDGTEIESELIQVTEGLPIVSGQLGVNINPQARGESYPGFVCFHQNRMVIGGSKGEPNTVYLSKINNHTNFQFFDEIEFEQNILKPQGEWVNPNIPEWNIRNAIVQQITMDSAICMRIMTDENEAIMWGASVKDLVLGTNTSEWIVPSDITAHSPTVTLTSRNGSADLQGRFIGKGIIFVSRTGNDIKSFNAQFGEMGDSISAQAEHIFKGAGGIKGFDFRQDPHTEIFAALKDGTIGAATMHPSGLGYYRITTRQGDLIDSVAVINENDEDGVYILARRVIDGGVYEQYLERLRTTDDSMFSGRAYLDSFKNGNTGIFALTGLHRFYKSGLGNHCQPGTVIAFDNGSVGTPLVRQDGSCSQYEVDGLIVSIPQNQPYIIGYKYRSHLKLNRTDSMEMEGVPKQGGSMYLRLYKSGDVFLVRDYDMDQLVRVYTPNNSAGVRQYPYTGGIRVENIAPAGPDQNIEIMTDTHESATIQVVSSMYTVGEGI